MLLHCCTCDVSVKTGTVDFSYKPFVTRGGKKKKKNSWKRIACFVVMYLLNSKFPPRFISEDTTTLEVLPTQAHKAGLFF